MTKRQRLLRGALFLAVLSIGDLQKVSCFATVPPMKEAPRPESTFYRRELPESCVPFSSPNGREIFKSAVQNNGLKSFYPLVEQFSTQSEPAYCGLSTLVIVLNTLNVDPRRAWKGPWRWYEESMLNCCVDLEAVKQTGISIKKFACLARCQGLSIDLTYAQDATIDDFRRAVRTACLEEESTTTTTATTSPETATESGPILVVSYHRGVLQQTGTGHFSPIAAYDAPSDRVLILDTARFKYGSHWVDLPLLFEAMKPIVKGTGKSRGFALMSFVGEPEQTTTTPHPTMLVRIKKQYPLLQQYKEFLDGHAKDEISWDTVLDYWTCGGSNPTLVWQALEPQLTPLDADVLEQAGALRKLVQKLLPSKLPAGRCCDVHNRRICLSAKEAIFVIYLASLPKHGREKAVGNDDDMSAVTRKNLLAEAELVRYAIQSTSRQ